ncbi:MAG: hypothetical protein KF905_14655 [Flavobacteriales bacterium]|nr:hypothetical protein [Flavobacteriales bacterium]
MKRYHLLLALLLCSSLQLNAQIGVGGNFNFYGYGQGLGGFPGLGINGSYAAKENMPIRFSYNYCFPKSDSYDASASAFSSETTPGSIVVPTKISYSIMHIHLDAQRFMFGGDYSGGVHANFGFGLAIAGVSQKPNSYSTALYQGPAKDKVTFVQPIFRLGLGYEKAAGFANIFIEAGVNLPANSVNNTAIAVTIPASYYGSVGVRHWLGESHSGGGGSKGKGKRKSKGKKKKKKKGGSSKKKRR